MSERPTISTASADGGSWVMKIRHESEVTIAEVWRFGVKLSVTTLTAAGEVTVQLS